MLCIASAHKSGSSFVASWLGACGVALSDGRPMGPGPGNPLGHFEDLDFFDLHVAAIKRQHPGSDGWRVLDGATVFTLPERQQVLALAKIRDQRHSAWGWKDPRSCLLLEEYAELLPNLTVLALWRPPEHIVASLLRRARSVPAGHESTLSAEQAAAVTQHYTRALADFVERHGEQCISVELAQVLDDDENVFRRVNAAVGHQLRYVPPSEVLRNDLLHR